MAHSSSPQRPLPYAIIGGGIGGLCLGLALTRRALPVHIYEAASRFGEIGAGVSLTPNALQALRLCHPAALAAFEKVCTRNQWEGKRGVWFDCYDGVKAGEDAGWVFRVESATGQNGVHRARFLEELVREFPAERASFGKRLESYAARGDGTVELAFRDGSTAYARAVIGCDGIKSSVRGAMFGRDHPCAQPTYTHKYAFRALAPMEEAVRAVGEEKAGNACAYLGKDNHLLAFVIDHGKTVNLVGFHSDAGEWPDSARLTAPATRDDALRAFAGFGPDVQKLLRLAKPDLDVWAIFHLGDHPPPAYNSGRVCILGDAAHATSPHHGAGAGICIEDAAVLASLLASPHLQSDADIAAAFAVYDRVRRPRGEWLVQSSFFMGEAWDLRVPELATFEATRQEILRRNRTIHDVDVRRMCEEAVEMLGQEVGTAR